MPKILLEINEFEYQELVERISKDVQKKVGAASRTRFLSLPIERLNITRRTINLLKAEKIETINDILEYKTDRGTCWPSSLNIIPNLGKGTYQEIKAALLEYGISTPHMG